MPSYCKRGKGRPMYGASYTNQVAVVDIAAVIHRSCHTQARVVRTYQVTQSYTNYN